MIDLYNTLTRKKDDFEPRGKRVNMFVCGPTVYDYSHIGHARTYIVFDVMAKYLRHSGFDVFYLQNITDIDDKIINRAEKLDTDPATLAQEFKDAYFLDMKSLGITAISEYAPATQYIPEIIDQVKRLLEKDVAYTIDGEGYYFDLSKFPDYGKLSGRTTQAAEDATSRIDESIKKKNKGDFVLWRFSKPEELGWDSELGYGRPGWHIEDTAITEKHFGPQYDIHGGAQDLIFPHHEAEIAQMESVSNKKPFVKYWLHTGFLTMEGKKMSKSLGNFITVREILKKYPAEALRFLILSSYYRSPVNYKEETMKSAEAATNRLGEFVNTLKSVPAEAKTEDKTAKEFASLIESTSQNFHTAMDDDLNTPEAISALFNLSRKANAWLKSGLLGHNDSLKILEFIENVKTILGIFPPKPPKTEEKIQKIVDERQSAREKRDFSKADELRKKIKNLGYEIDDTNYGPLVKKV